MEPTDKQLEAQLRDITDRFEQQMRARGFDLEQTENVALPEALARLYVERQSLLEKLEKIRGKASNEGT